VAEISWFSHGCHSASQNETEEENNMTEIKEKEIRATPEAVSKQPMLSMRLGRTNFLIGLYFAEDGNESLDDKVKHLIKKDIQDENF
jgi:hypothetical protein